MWERKRRGVDRERERENSEIPAVARTPSTSAFLRHQAQARQRNSPASFQSLHHSDRLLLTFLATGRLFTQPLCLDSGRTAGSAALA